MTRLRIVVLIAIVALIAGFFLFDLQHFFTLDALKAQRAMLAEYRDARPLAAAATYFVIYVAVAGLSLPGAAVLTLAGGAIFGLLWGTLLVSFASALGATLAFLTARLLLRDTVRARFAERLKTIDHGMARGGPYYLFTLRLVPAIPFFVVNLVMGLTALPLLTFYWVSQVGMLAGTIAFVNAGTQLARVESLADILSPGLLFSFVLLGCLPLVVKHLVDWVRARQVYARWPRPAKFDRNLIVIGAGSAGLVTAYIAAAAKASVTLIEKDAMGGDCLNTGCVPSKALIRSAIRSTAKASSVY